MIRFYFHPTPNLAKVALFLEETVLPYEAVPIDTSKGEQHTPVFRAINPNGKVPAIVDTDARHDRSLLLANPERPQNHDISRRSGVGRAASCPPTCVADSP
jgi:hypothetical protein